MAKVERTKFLLAAEITQAATGENIDTDAIARAAYDLRRLSRHPRERALVIRRVEQSNELIVVHTMQRCL